MHSRKHKNYTFGEPQIYLLWGAEKHSLVNIWAVPTFWQLCIMAPELKEDLEEISSLRVYLEAG